MRPCNDTLGLSCIFCFFSGRRTSHHWQDSTYFSRPAELVILLKQGQSFPACNYFPTPWDRSIVSYFKGLISSFYWKYIQTEPPLTMTEVHFQSGLPFMCSVFCLFTPAAVLFSQCYSAAKPCHLLIMIKWVCLFNKHLLSHLLSSTTTIPLPVLRKCVRTCASATDHTYFQIWSDYSTRQIVNPFGVFKLAINTTLESLNRFLSSHHRSDNV